jgi:hypothetical protein
VQHGRLHADGLQQFMPNARCGLHHQLAYAVQFNVVPVHRRHKQGFSLQMNDEEQVLCYTVPGGRWC